MGFVMSKLTVQLVTWNNADSLASTLEALATAPAEVFIRVLDNGSTDDSVRMVRKALPQAEVIELGKNYGFCDAHNIGFSLCETEFVLVHNPDLQMSWKALPELLSVFDDPQTAAVQGKLMRDTSANTLDSAGIEMTWALNGKERGAGERDTGQYDTARDVAAVTGAAAIYRLSALQKVSHGKYAVAGYENVPEIFDRDFFAYKEDVDLGWRLRRAGYLHRYVPVVQGVHARAVSERIAIWRRLRDRRTQYSFRNWNWMVYKNVSLKEAFLHELFVDARLFTFGLMTLFYPRVCLVWWETIRGIPRMLSKRDVGAR